MFKATPAAHRSLRHIAEEKNQRFETAPDYCAQCGQPLTGGLPHGHYEDTAVQAKPNHPTGAMTVFATSKGK